MATSYTFDAGHFEEECLARFLMMESDPAESPRSYLVEREEKLSETFACVLVDQRSVSAERSLRWHLLGIRLPGVGIQHAKVSLLLWERQLRILIGSANLTEPGYRANLEVVVPLDFSPEGGAPPALALQCVDFLEELGSFASGATDRPGPRRALAEFLARTRERLRSWKDSAAPTGVRCELVPLLPNGRHPSVFDQARGLWQPWPAPTHARVLSPFFDRSDAAIDRVYRELEALMTTRGKREINFVSGGRETANGIIQVDIPSRLMEPSLRHASMEHGVGYVSDLQSVEDGEVPRPLHSKALFLDREENSVVLLGSSNFTLAGLGLIPTHNVEINVAYRIPQGEPRFYAQCEAALPPIIWLEDGAARELIQIAESSEDVTSLASVLPRGFVEALYRPDLSGGSLELVLEPAALPQSFTIALADETFLLDAVGWRTQFDGAACVVLPLSVPASGLFVQWESEGATHRAVWAVNAFDVSLLIPPQELRDLSLEELILVLTSTRPAFQVLAILLESRARYGSTTSVVDPHKKVDTSRFLLKRMRRLATAMEGLRVRLGRPITSLEGWRWRLQGPLGPLALARAIKAESGQEAAFFISELAATLKALPWTVALGVGLSEAVAREELELTLRMLGELSFDGVGELPANLLAYVREVFPEGAR